MKKTLLLLAATLVCAVAAAQYQLPNAGFEQWDGGNTSEPASWNTFSSSDGSFAVLASSNHHYRRSGGRPGTDGSYYLTIYTQSIFGINANGNMTTGRIHAGAMQAASSENYNYTQRADADHCQPFTGTPDSMYVWVSYYAASASSQAQVSAILHGDNDFKAPNQEGDASLYCGKAQVAFSRTTASATSMQWQQLKVPFVYDGTASANYMLVNLTTNITPGGGDANDSLSVDDIEFVYSSWLDSLLVNGQAVEGFSKSVFAYSMAIGDTAALHAAVVTGIPEVSDATVDIARAYTNDSTATVIITVTAEDGVTVHTYTITLNATMPSVPEPNPNVGIEVDDGAEPVFAVYPNPAVDKVSVTADGTVTLHDLGGRTLSTQTVYGTASFDLTGLPAGTYVLRCGNRAQSIVKQ